LLFGGSCNLVPSFLRGISGGLHPAGVCRQRQGLVRKRGTSTLGGEVGEKARRIEGTAEGVCASFGVVGAGLESVLVS
jgi:hypothetical protein